MEDFIFSIFSSKEGSFDFEARNLSPLFFLFLKRKYPILLRVYLSFSIFFLHRWKFF